MTIDLVELYKRNKELECQKREDYKARAARRLELGSWHTITERAVKVRDGKNVRWESEPIEDHDARCYEMVFNPDHEDHPSWSRLGREYLSRQKPPVTSYRAMYIGYRYKFNGGWEAHRPYGPEDDYYDYFAQSKAVEVWMFVTHDNRNPVAVFPFEIEGQEENAQ